MARPLLLLALHLLLVPLSSCSFTIYNNCPNTIWPGTLAGAGTLQLPLTGFRLDSGESVRLPAPPGWSGRIWARTGCDFDNAGAGTCQTGDCGGRMECNGMAALPPATLFEVTLGKGTEQDYYDVSLVDGYNLPVIAAPKLAIGACNVTGCVADLNAGCPRELQVDGNGTGVIACRSACEAFALDKYCCSGDYANPTTCKPSSYSDLFKAACPMAYSYAFDDRTSTFTCKAADYTIVFCPRVMRPNSISSNQPIHGIGSSKPTQGVDTSSLSRHGYQDEPKEIASSAITLSFNFSFLMLYSVLFQVLAHAREIAELITMPSCETSTQVARKKTERNGEHKVTCIQPFGHTKTTLPLLQGSPSS